MLSFIWGYVMLQPAKGSKRTLKAASGPAAAVGLEVDEDATRAKQRRTKKGKKATGGQAGEAESANADAGGEGEDDSAAANVAVGLEIAAEEGLRMKESGLGDRDLSGFAGGDKEEKARTLEAVKRLGFRSKSAQSLQDGDIASMYTITLHYHE